MELLEEAHLRIVLERTANLAEAAQVLGSIRPPLPETQEIGLE